MRRGLAHTSATTIEFTSGEGARDGVTRTIFAVGDEKQSIFSFQGAAPREFDGMRRHFMEQHDRAQLGFVKTEFKHSFRSGEIVLPGAVNFTFAGRERNVLLITSDTAVWAATLDTKGA
jgi:ATP-dependent helicase/nuclease subunit A